MKQGIKKGCCVVLGMAVLLAGYGYGVEPRRLKVRHLTVSGRGTKDFRMVFFSDTHFGKYYPQSRAEHLMQLIKAQAPDLVLFGGDLVDQYVRDEQQLDLSSLAQCLGSLSSPQGVYAVWGNHDYSGGGIGIYEKVMNEASVTLLKNEAIYLPDLDMTLMGIDDSFYGTPVWQKAWDEAKGTRILLGHEPDEAAAMAGDVDLILSGHSHGGQVRLPVVTQLFLPPGAHTYIKGLFERENGAILVSSGVGMTKLPLRLGNPPEIWVINVKSDQGRR